MFLEVLVKYDTQHLADPSKIGYCIHFNSVIVYMTQIFLILVYTY